jgi:hypothetical protein
VCRAPGVIRTHKRGIWLLKNPATNKGLASPPERDRLAARPAAADHAVDGAAGGARTEHVRAKSANLEKYIGLAGLLHRYDVLFYRLLVENLPELMPIVYTPTVGEACQRYSHIVRDMRGLWLTPDDVSYDRLRTYLQTSASSYHRQRHSRAGRSGAGGMGIPWASCRSTWRAPASTRRRSCRSASTRHEQRAAR